MKNKENTVIWGIIALVAFVVMMFTLGANEAEYLSNKAFFVGFAVQVTVSIYALYRAKAYVWQNAKKRKKNQKERMLKNEHLRNQRNVTRLVISGRERRK